MKYLYISITYGYICVNETESIVFVSLCHTYEPNVVYNWVSKFGPTYNKQVVNPRQTLKLEQPDNRRYLIAVLMFISSLYHLFQRHLQSSGPIVISRVTHNSLVANAFQGSSRKVLLNNTTMSTHRGRHNIEGDIFISISLNQNPNIFQFQFHRSLFLKMQLTIRHQWFK